MPISWKERNLPSIYMKKCASLDPLRIHQAVSASRSFASGGGRPSWAAVQAVAAAAVRRWRTSGSAASRACVPLEGVAGDLPWGDWRHAYVCRQPGRRYLDAEAEGRSNAVWAARPRAALSSLHDGRPSGRFVNFTSRRPNQPDGPDRMNARSNG
jgi:hypothetical protein